MMKKLIIFFLVLLISVSLYIVFVPKDNSQEKENSWAWKEKWYEAFELENGLKVIVIPNTKIPAVSHMLWYKVGGQDENPGKSGIAHFLEHLLFKGTTKFPDGEFSKIVALNGGKENAFTSQDFTAYYQKIAKDKLSIVMEMEADRMRNVILTDADVDSERSVILEERNMRTDNNPRAILREQMDATLYLNHPYGTPLIGWRHEMESLNKLDALEFYYKYYAPNNAFLILAGDITAEEARPLAEQYYGSVPTGGIIARKNIVEPPQIAARRVDYEDVRVQSPELWRSYLAPSFASGETQHAYALSVLERVLGSGTVSRLYQSLVVEQKIATAAGTSYSGIVRGPSKFAVYALPAKDIPIDQLEAAIDLELQKILERGITAEELRSAKKAMIAEMVYSREGLHGLSYIMGQVVSVGLNPEFISGWTDQVDAVTLEQVSAAAKHVFDKKKSVTGILTGTSRGAE